MCTPYVGTSVAGRNETVTKLVDRTKLSLVHLLSW
jgi:hypothetical protein